MLALELLKILLENSGPLFRSTERFVTAIKQYLCLSLLKNCQSAVPAALRLCCSIFLTLMTKFRKSLKAEIGVFFPMILLRPIEPAVLGATPNAAGAARLCGSFFGGFIAGGGWHLPWGAGSPKNSAAAVSVAGWVAHEDCCPACLTAAHPSAPASPPPPSPSPAAAGGGASAPVDIAHKAVVLRCLQAQCEDGQLLVDLFVNYDCDLEGANLFERCVTALVRISQGSLAHEQGAGAHTPLEEQAIRYEVRARCLEWVGGSVVGWLAPGCSWWSSDQAHGHQPLSVPAVDWNGLDGQAVGFMRAAACACPPPAGPALPGVPAQIVGSLAQEHDSRGGSSRQRHACRGSSCGRGGRHSGGGGDCGCGRRKHARGWLDGEGC